MPSAPSLRVAILSLSLAGSAMAEEIGVAVRVRPEVLAFPVGKPHRELDVNDPIERGLRVELRGKSPYLSVAFNLGGDMRLAGPGRYQFDGVASLAGQSEIKFGETEKPVLRRIYLLQGRLRLYLLPGKPLDVETPTALAGVKGSALRILVSPEVGTFLAVDEGETSVQAKAGGEPVTVRAGQWVLVPPAGLPTRPAPLGPGDEFLEGPLIPCCPGLEPPKRPATGLPPQ